MNKVSGKAASSRISAPLRIPLAWQLALSFFLVSTLALSSVGVLSSALTRSEFRTLLSEQERERLETQLQTHLAAGGQLEDFGTNEADAGAARHSAPDSLQNHPGHRPPSSFVLTDPQFRPISGRSWAGPPLTERERSSAVPVIYGGQKVAYLVPRGRPDIVGEANAAFLRRTTQAIAWAAAGSALLAALLGGWLSRQLLQPLSRLQSGIAALARGEEPQPLPPRPVQDELSDLLSSFEQMHAEVVRAQQAGRQLTADIAHDLNTPLTVIRGQLEAMLDGTFQPTPARLERLNDQAEHLAQLVADLRLLAQAEAGELPLHPQPTQLAPLIEGAALAFGPLAARYGSALRLEVPPDLTVTADPSRLRQVLDNLLGNALNHAPGTPVTVQAQQAAGGVTITVQDRGPGVLPEQLPYLFERLYRADPSRQSGPGGGSGLGLSISRSIVQAHGGHISAHNLVEGSSHEVGTTGLMVKMWLPA